MNSFLNLKFNIFIATLRIYLNVSVKEIKLYFYLLYFYYYLLSNCES